MWNQYMCVNFANRNPQSDFENTKFILLGCFLQNGFFTSGTQSHNSTYGYELHTKVSTSY